MGRPQRIKKKNSILFTTKHHSFNAIIGTVLLVMCMLVMGTSIAYAFHKGAITESFGYYGFLTALLNVLGLIAGILGYKERDTYKAAPIIAIAGNSIMLGIWALLIVVSR